MFGISFLELVVIFLLVLIVMGPEKLPEFARWAGKGLRELRKASNTLRNALTMEEFDEDFASPKAKAIASESPTEATSAPEEPSRNVAQASAAEPESSPPAAGLDQVDDDQFERMLEQQYSVQGTEMHSVALPAAEPGTDVVTVEIAPRRRDAVDCTVIDLNPRPTAEVAS